MKKWLLEKLELKSFPTDPVFYVLHLTGLVAKKMLRRHLAKKRDACEICHGARGGVRGNENIVFYDARGCRTVLCDYCHADLMKVREPRVRTSKGE
jgi:hypothetical protein